MFDDSTHYTQEEYLEALREALSIFDEPDYDDDEDYDPNQINWAT